MASLTNHTTLLALLFLLIVLAAQMNLNSADFSVDWSTGRLMSSSSSSAFDEFGEGVSRMGLEQEDAEDGYGEEEIRRSLFWRAARYYISYGALSANRVPCPPRSGRSYYTHNCFKARGTVRPYVRGCSAISHCRR